MSPDNRMSPAIGHSVGVRFMSNAVGRNEIAIIFLRVHIVLIILLFSAGFWQELKLYVYLTQQSTSRNKKKCVRKPRNNLLHTSK